MSPGLAIFSWDSPKFSEMSSGLIKLLTHSIIYTMIYLLTQSTWWVPHVEQKLLTLPGHLVHPSFLRGLYCLIFSFPCNVLYIIVSPFVLFLWPLFCLSFFDYQLLITPLVTLNFFLHNWYTYPLIKHFLHNWDTYNPWFVSAVLHLGNYSTENSRPEVHPCQLCLLPGNNLLQTLARNNVSQI